MLDMQKGGVKKKKGKRKREKEYSPQVNGGGKLGYLRRGYFAGCKPSAFEFGSQWLSCSHDGVAI